MSGAPWGWGTIASHAPPVSIARFAVTVKLGSPGTGTHSAPMFDGLNGSPADPSPAMASDPPGTDASARTSLQLAVAPGARHRPSALHAKLAGQSVVSEHVTSQSRNEARYEQPASASATQQWICNPRHHRRIIIAWRPYRYCRD
jgi:hypothetical protein